VTSPSVKRRPLRLFFCYAHENADVRAALDRHLDILEREALVTTWYDGAITPGSRWSEAIEESLRGADIIVLLVSRAFLDSKYIAEVEMRLALELHRAKVSVPIPVLVEEVDCYAELPLSAFETLPHKAKPISEWQDLVRAFDSVVAGIRRAALRLLAESGGAFDPGPHPFGEAELVSVDHADRGRTLAGLSRLRSALVDEVPARRLDGNLLVANWCLNKLGRRASSIEALFYMAQVLSAFDVISLQEIDRRLGALRSLLDILGPEWSYFITDITEGMPGNAERFAILYYAQRVAFEHVSGEVILPDDLLIDGHQFARKPLLASFRAAAFHFRVCAAHIHYGGGDPKRGIRECKVLARFLKRVAKRDGENIVLAGNFNLRRADSPALQAFRDEGFRIPPEIVHPSLARNPSFYSDLVGLFAACPGAVDFGASGAFQPFAHVFRDADAATYPDPSHFGTWRCAELSDHVPVWLELTFPATSGRDAASLPS